MARRAHTAGPAVIHVPPGVVKLGVQPSRGVVTGFARRREMRGGVVWVRCPVVVSRVARIAKGGADVVVVIDVAIGASPWRNSMHAGQRPAGLCVVECAVHPVHGVMAHLAGGGELRRDVIDR